MIQAQAHRGPDDEGMYTATAGPVQLAMGSRRLAVLDLSASGHQPMTNEDGTVWVVCNGELYNFRELRDELERRGHRFLSGTDTEVLVHAYEAYGDDFVTRLRGMFAFALWDATRARLVLARDRFGEKPLYLSRFGQTLVFASELRALLASGLVERRVNFAALLGYLQLGSVPAPLTLIEGVESVEPGTVVEVEDGLVRVRRYWELRFDEDETMTREEAVDGLEARLLDAVRSRLASDVPLGVFLSGGIDSSGITALMRDVGVRHMRTYSLAFEDPAFDESSFARQVAERFSTDHSEYVVTAPGVLAMLDDILSAMDQPTVDGLNTYIVSRFTREAGTVVAMSGLGGDELFGGYSSFWHAPRLMWLGRALGWAPGSRQLLERGLRAVAWEGRSEKLRMFLRHQPSADAAYLTAKGLLVGEALEDLLAVEGPTSGATFDALSYLQRFGGSSGTSAFNRISLLELSTYMHNQLLRDADVMSMAHGLEIRVPLLDHQLIEFVARIPARWKAAQPPKQLFVAALRGRLPSTVTNRPKGAFAFPLEHWITSSWRDAIEERLFARAPAVDGLFQQAGLEALWNGLRQGRTRWSRVWAIVVLQEWLRRHLAAESPLREPTSLVANH